MKKQEKIFIGTITSMIFLFILFLGGMIFIGGIKGALLLISLGIISEIFLMKKYLNHFYSFGRAVLIGIYIFFSIGMFGVFMGVPAFNVSIGICAGAYMGRRLYLQGVTAQEYGTDLKKTGIFSAIIMIFVCMLSAYFALTDPYTAANLEGMFNTSFQITNEMIYGLVIIGGIGLIVFQYFSTIVAGKIAYKMGSAA